MTTVKLKLTIIVCHLLLTGLQPKYMGISVKNFVRAWLGEGGGQWPNVKVRFWVAMKKKVGKHCLNPRNSVKFHWFVTELTQSFHTLCRHQPWQIPESFPFPRRAWTLRSSATRRSDAGRHDPVWHPAWAEFGVSRRLGLCTRPATHRTSRSRPEDSALGWSRCQPARVLPEHTPRHTSSVNCAKVKHSRAEIIIILTLMTPMTGGAAQWPRFQFLAGRLSLPCAHSMADKRPLCG